MMKENPFSALISFMQDEGKAYNPPTIAIGIVTSVEPLKIMVGELLIDKDDFLISEFLLKDYERQISVNNGTPQSYKTKDMIKVGDKLAVLPTADRQKYIVISKVVAL